MQVALTRGDNQEYNRLVEQMKDVVSTQGVGKLSQQPSTSQASLLKQNKPRGVEKTAEEVLSTTVNKVGLPSGLTIESIIINEMNGDSKKRLEKPTPTATTSSRLTAPVSSLPDSKLSQEVATMSSKMTSNTKKEMLVTSSKTPNILNNCQDLSVTSKVPEMSVTVSTVQAKIVPANVTTQHGSNDQQQSLLSVHQSNSYKLTSQQQQQQQQQSSPLPMTLVSSSSPINMHQQKPVSQQQQQILQQQQQQQSLLQQQKQQQQQ